MRNNDPRVTWLVRGVRALSLGLSARQPVLSHGPHTASALNPKAHYLPPLHVPRAPAFGTAPLPPALAPATVPPSLETRSPAFIPLGTPGAGPYQASVTFRQSGDSPFWGRSGTQ